jgi:hypothetical protein
MNPIKSAFELLYRILRVLFLPIILLCRPTGLRPESIVATTTVAVFIFVLQPFVAAHFGAGYAVALTAVGALLAYCFLVWGKEFEKGSLEN